MMDDDRLPTALWVDAHMRRLAEQGQAYYIVQKGAYAGGMVLLKLYHPGEGCLLLTQQRNLDGVLGWMKLFKGSYVAENEADDYVRRACDRDPDLWVIEIEGPGAENPFEGPVF